MAAPRQPRHLHAAIAAAIAAIFAVDMHTPLGLGVPFLYLLVALFAAWNRIGSRFLVAIAALCTGLAGVKLLMPSPGGVVSLGEGNRFIFTVLIWVLVVLELARRNFDARIEEVRARSRQELEQLVQERTRALHAANGLLQNEVAERRQAERTIADYAERLHGLANQLVEAQETERQHLAAELHDRIGQNLSVLNINLSLGLSQLPADATAAARIRDSLELVERTTEMVRGVMEELRPTLLDQYGLDAALRWYGDEFARRTGIRVACEATELFPRLQPKVEMALFRIAQEALTNVAKHARAANATLSLRRTPAGIELKVADDGIGIRPEMAGRQAVGSGWGMAIMVERARSIGADFQIDPLTSRGTSVMARIANGLWEIDSGHHSTDR